MIGDDPDEVAGVDLSLRLHRGIPGAELTVILAAHHGVGDQSRLWHHLQMAGLSSLANSPGPV